jgi:hypothetical protein
MKKTNTDKIKKARLQFIGMILFLPFMFVMANLILPELPSSPMLRDSFWAHKIDAQPQYDIVFVGDSRIYRGIDPQTFDSTLGNKVRSFNYGFSSAGLDSFLLGHASQVLDPKGSKTMLIGISVNSFLPESLGNGHLHSLLSWNRKDVWIKKNLYPDLNCFDPYSFSDIYKHFKKEAYREHYHLTSGFAASDRVPPDSNSALPAYEKQLERQEYLHEAEGRFMAYLDILKTQGIRVMVLRMPTSKDMRKLEDEKLGKQFEQLQRRLEERGVLWLEVPGTFESYDGSHLNSISAKRFSMGLAAFLKS